MKKTQKTKNPCVACGNSFESKNILWKHKRNCKPAIETNNRFSPLSQSESEGSDSDSSKYSNKKMKMKG